MITQPTNKQIREYAKKLALKANTKAGANSPNVDERMLHVYRTEDNTPLYWRMRVKCKSTGDKFIRPFY